jgi:hypothetical protein
LRGRVQKFRSVVGHRRGNSKILSPFGKLEVSELEVENWEIEVDKTVANFFRTIFAL